MSPAFPDAIPKLLIIAFIHYQYKLKKIQTPNTKENLLVQTVRVHS